MPDSCQRDGRSCCLCDAQRFRDPEIRDDGRATRDQNVVRLDIPVDDASRVRKHERTPDVT